MNKENSQDMISEDNDENTHENKPVFDADTQEHCEISELENVQELTRESDQESEQELIEEDDQECAHELISIDNQNNIQAMAITNNQEHEERDVHYLKKFVEAALLANDHPLSIEQIRHLFEEQERPTANEIREALNLISTECEDRGIELAEVASGFRFQIKIQFSPRLGKLWEERPPRYSRALLETLALIAYRQPITRAEIEDIRGVVVSSHIIKILLEREWIRVVGHRDVPGKPGLYATTKQFLDYFNMKSLAELPTLTEIKNLDLLADQLESQGNSTVADISHEAEEIVTDNVHFLDQADKPIANDINETDEYAKNDETVLEEQQEIEAEFASAEENIIGESRLDGLSEEETQVGAEDDLAEYSEDNAAIISETLIGEHSADENRLSGNQQEDEINDELMVIE